MDHEQYVKYFNSKQPKGLRKISVDCLLAFEKEKGYKEPHYKHIKHIN